MNKEELINLKKQLTTKVCPIYSSGSGKVVSLYEIEQRKDTNGAIEMVEQCFEDIIRHFAKEEYDSITLDFDFGFVVKEKDLTDEGVKPNFKPISRLALIDIWNFACFGKDKIYDDDPDIVYSKSRKEFVVDFNEFVSLLNKRGFETNFFDSIEDIKKSIINSKSCLQTICLTLKKKKVKVKNEKLGNN